MTSSVHCGPINVHSGHTGAGRDTAAWLFAAVASRPFQGLDLGGRRVTVARSAALVAGSCLVAALVIDRTRHGRLPKERDNR